MLVSVISTCYNSPCSPFFLKSQLSLFASSSELSQGKFIYQTKMMQAHSNLQKRDSALIAEANPASCKKRRSRMGSSMNSLQRKQEGNDFTTEEEKYSDIEDNNDVGYNADKEKVDDLTDDHQEEAVYSLGDESPIGAEDNNAVSDSADKEKVGDDHAADDHQEEAEYLLRDEGPIGVEEELCKGMPKEEDEKNKHSTRHFSHGCHLIQGKMNHGMEDYLFTKRRNFNGHDLGLYAIFDGHAGRDVAKYLQGHLFENILSEPDFWKKPVHAVNKAFKDTDDQILKNITDSRGGSTAVAAILVNGVKLLLANVGDSRAISCKNGLAQQLTVDHEPEKEKDLIESRGGFVSKKPGNVPRVDGQLAMTRAFGDGKLKDHITAEPDVMIRKIDEDTEFIILASDGLWKVMTNQQACDCIRDVDEAQKASTKLVNEAKSLGSYDDISCIVVLF